MRNSVIACRAAPRRAQPLQRLVQVVAGIAPRILARDVVQLVHKDRAFIVDRLRVLGVKGHHAQVDHALVVIDADLAFPFRQQILQRGVAGIGEDGVVLGLRPDGAQVQLVIDPLH
ncbi:hypothetical protein [Paracoccus fontiphilus]|uniref:Uncharacterized protein n=1 Tax=Paracoccus fontiphilus TaxID=1815556 RepID=A0ABV7IMJ2_9RHOB|nr:hypothetical protein [Paracoccus fontiphilus]